MATPAPTATAAIRTATACGDNAPPASQMTTNATAVTKPITTTRSVRWPAPAERKSAIATRYRAGPPQRMSRSPSERVPGGGGFDRQLDADAGDRDTHPDEDVPVTPDE